MPRSCISTLALTKPNRTLPTPGLLPPGFCIAHGHERWKNHKDGFSGIILACIRSVTAIPGLGPIVFLVASSHATIIAGSMHPTIVSTGVAPFRFGPNNCTAYTLLHFHTSTSIMYFIFFQYTRTGAMKEWIKLSCSRDEATSGAAGDSEFRRHIAQRGRSEYSVRNIVPKQIVDSRAVQCSIIQRNNTIIKLLCASPACDGVLARVISSTSCFK
jgi:hypothetical protein